MKKLERSLIALAVMLCATFSAEAQYILSDVTETPQTANFWISGYGRTNNGLWVTKHGADVPISGIRITNPSGVKGVNFQLTDSLSAYQGFSTWLHNGTTWVERMRIAAATGCVGIGTTEPLYKLDIQDTSSIKYLPQDARNLPRGSLMEIKNNTSLDGAYTGILFTTRNTATVNNVSYIGSISNPGAATYAPDIVFGVRTAFASFKEAMRITAAGSVGIGATIIDSEYKLVVNGTIGASRIKVTKTNWADFVFDPAYDLPSLYEIEQFVKLHRHLPDVPSADEVKKDGVDLGEMNKILLQKIEELTLHLINEHKHNEQLQQEVKAMKEEMTTIKEMHKKQSTSNP